MELEDFKGKHIIITMHDGEMVDGILVSIKDIDNPLESIFYTSLTIRVDADNYRTIYINEIDTIGEIN